jgi:hypothetical protein
MMEDALRIRFVNTVLLAGILLMYVVYDTAFRFWMSQSDTVNLSAAILHDTASLQAIGESGVAFETATEVTSTPALQTYLYESYRWSRASGDATTNQQKRAQGSSADNEESDTVADRKYTPQPSAHDDVDAALSKFPMAAVVVESTWLSPDHGHVSAAYAQRLLEGVRYALFTGAPWLLLAGTAEETSLGLQYLRHLPQPAEALFGQAAQARWPSELSRLAESLRTSMAPYDTLEAWLHGADTKAIPSFATTSLRTAAAASSLLGESAPSSTNTTSAGLQFSLQHLLSVSALAGVAEEVSSYSTASYERSSSLILGAEWLRRTDAAFLVSGARSGEYSGPAPTPSPASSADTGNKATEPQVTVYATGDAYIKDGVNNGSSSSTINVWEVPRVRELQISGAAQRVHLTLPGIVAVVATDANQRSRVVAKVLQQLLEETVVQRHALRLDASSPPRSGVANGWWWWLGRLYGVTVIGGGWEQQRVKLLYIKALREAAARAQETLRKAVQDIHCARCRFEGSVASPLCSGARWGKLPKSAMPFTTATPRPPKVFVLPPAFEETPVMEVLPEWLNYTGELPPSVNAGASHAARVIGRWSFYLYANYRRWMDGFLASLPGGVYQDHFVLVSLLMSDLADYRISWWDVFHLR